MSYVYLTPEIMVPQEWPISKQKKFFTGLCKHLINIDDPRSPVYFKVGDTTTKISRSKNTPKFTFVVTEESVGDEALVVSVLWPKKIQIVRKNNRPSQPEEAVELVPMTLEQDFEIHRINVSGTDQEKYLMVVPDTKKILESMGITGPEALEYAIKTKYTLKGDKKTNVETITIDDGPSTSADFTLREQAKQEDVDIIYLDCLPRPGLPRRVKRATVLCCVFAILFLILFCCIFTLGFLIFGLF